MGMGGVVVRERTTPRFPQEGAPPASLGSWLPPLSLPLLPQTDGSLSLPPRQWRQVRAYECSTLATIRSASQSGVGLPGAHCHCSLTWTAAMI
eukprot:scaffold134989_cov33-Tisochrysis_lutea.AAC.3